MGKRQKICLLCAEGDREALQPVLDALQARGVSVSEKADTLLAVLSERFYADEALKTALLEAVSAGAAGVLPLRLDKAEQPPEIKTALYARNIIPADERSAEQTAERIIAALPEKKNRMGAALIAGAAALAVLAGVLIWRAVPKEETEPAEPVMAEEITIPAELGLSLEDLQNIRSVVIVGDEAHFLETSIAGGYAPNVREYAADNDWDGWFSKADGHKYSLTRYDDLRFLALMPNLKNLSFALADIPEPPDLSGTHLRRVEFYECGIDRLDWFDAEDLEEATVYGCPVEDFSPLSASEAPLRAEFGFTEEAEPDLSGFCPGKLSSLSLSGSPRAIQMPPLAGCSGLHELRLRNLPLENLDFLAGSDVYRLYLSSLHRLGDLSALVGLEHLCELQMEDCDAVPDYAPLAACGALQQICLNSYNNRVCDVSFLEGKTGLRDIQLHGCSIPDLNFMRSLSGQKQPIRFGFNGSCGDFSGLAEIARYDEVFLNIRGGFDGALTALRDAEIDTLTLHGARGLDFGLIPAGTLHLQLRECDIGQDLSALPPLALTELQLWDIPTLTSLNGLQNLPTLTKKAMLCLEIRNCPRLTDWSALDGMELDSLALAGVYSLPDFSELRFHCLQLDSLDWMEDLSCLDALKAGYRGYSRFSLPGMEQIRDLSPIARVIRDGFLEVPPQLEEQAKELQQQGKIQWYGVVYPEGGWELDRSELSLLSLDELNTLPGPLLRRVTTLAVAGDTVFDPNVYEVWNRWEGNAERFYLVDRLSREETPARMGAITDLSAFSALTGLKNLTLVCQPIDSLAGLENMEKLQALELKDCPELTDLSPAFAVQNLEKIWIEHSPVSSIQGVQNLYRLNELVLNGTQASDLSPLTECDFGEAEQRGGVRIDLDNIPCRDFSPLASIGHFRSLNVNNIDVALWREAVRDCRIEELECVNAGIDNETLAGLLSEHPELRRLGVSWSPELSDLTPLLELESLEEVRVSRDMTQAIDSLNGKDLRFRLEIEG